ncbi:hypothetical protein Lal_00019073 [Lupinus albus]|nr:hypothetical protein Lal_00019073 [Lupinus albus]
MCPSSDKLAFSPLEAARTNVRGAESEHIRVRALPLSTDLRENKQNEIDMYLMESTSYVERPSFRPAQLSYPSGPMHWAHIMDGGNKMCTNDNSKRHTSVAYLPFRWHQRDPAKPSRKQRERSKQSRSFARSKTRKQSCRISGGLTLRTEECSCPKVNNALASRVRCFSQAGEGLILLAFV